MQPSSLIFLVIVAIWVAYLVQHWVHRREHLATARSVDKFSDAMRLLERRSPVTEPSPSPSATRSRGAMLLDAVTARSAEAGGPAPSPLRARTRGEGALPPAHDIPVIELVPHRTPAQIIMRRVRGLFFLAALVAVPVCLVLSVAHVLKWLSIGIALAGLAVAVVWLRVEAIRAQKARRARRAAHRQLAASRAGQGRSSIRGRRTLAGSGRSGRPAATAPAATAPATAFTAEVRREAAAPDVRGASTAPKPAPEPELVPGSWRPVPVPPPTYTLKEPAHVREPGRPVPIEVEDEIESVPPVRQRRVVGS